MHIPSGDGREWWSFGTANGWWAGELVNDGGGVMARAGGTFPSDEQNLDAIAQYIVRSIADEVLARAVSVIEEGDMYGEHAALRMDLRRVRQSLDQQQRDAGARAWQT